MSTINTRGPLSYEQFATAFMQAHPAYILLGARLIGPAVRWWCGQRMMAAWCRYQRVHALRRAAGVRT